MKVEIVIRGRMKREIARKGRMKRERGRMKVKVKVKVERDVTGKLQIPIHFTLPFLTIHFPPSPIHSQ